MVKSGEEQRRKVPDSVISYQGKEVAGIIILFVVVVLDVGIDLI